MNAIFLELRKDQLDSGNLRCCWTISPDGTGMIRTGKILGRDT